MRSGCLLQITLVALVTLFAGMVWLSYHPQHELLTEARQWPVIGPAAAALQDAYTPQQTTQQTEQQNGPPSAPGSPPPAADNSRRQPTSTGPAPTGEDIADAGESSGFQGPQRMLVDGEEVQYDVPELHWLQRGVQLRREPSAQAEVILELDNPAPLALLERRGEWALMRAGPHRGWTPLNESTLHTEPPLGSAAQPVTALPGRSADPERLDRAVELLLAVRPGQTLGPYALYTDVQDRALLEDLESLVISLESTYARRFGLSPRDQARESVVLYRNAEAYQRYRQQEASLAGLESVGHAGHGMAVLFVGERHRDEIAATLSHELTHLLNRRAVGPALPPWLDEGLAEALSQSRRRADGSLDPAELGGLVTTIGITRSVSGARASLEFLERRRGEGRLLPLQRLTALEWQPFVNPRQSELHYSQSAFVVRWLLEDPYRATFQSYLASVSEGASVDPERLRAQLGASWEDLDADFARYVSERYATLAEESS
ncbi:MAG: hypothetical protein AAGD01_20415 [Acidobacteriota bacterium]